MVVHCRSLSFPEHSEKILDTLHFLLNGEVGRGAALAMICARDEGLVRNIAHAKISTEFKHVSKTAYNNYLHERFTDKEKNRIISTLRTRIGYIFCWVQRKECSTEAS